MIKIMADDKVIWLNPLIWSKCNVRHYRDFTCRWGKIVYDSKMDWAHAADDKCDFIVLCLLHLWTEVSVSTNNYSACFVSILDDHIIIQPRCPFIDSLYVNWVLYRSNFVTLNHSEYFDLLVLLYRTWLGIALCRDASWEGGAGVVVGIVVRCLPGWAWLLTGNQDSTAVKI
jgi:hypothetical protein